MEYAFHLYNKLAADGVAMATDKLLRLHAQGKYSKRKGAGMRSPLYSKDDSSPNTVSDNTTLDAPQPPPIIVCVGSDLAIGDCLGPITGSMLKFKTQGLNAFIYGTLGSPVTAKEIGHLRSFLKETHLGSQVIAIDAAVGEQGDIGLIKTTDHPLLPGAGANKKLGALGDISILGVVAEKSVANYGLLNTTRLNLVYTMSEIISDGVAALLWERCHAQQSSIPKNA